MNHVVDPATDEVERFTSDRLVGTRLRQSHAAWLEQLHADPHVMATLGGLRDAAQSQEWLDDNLTHWADHRFGQWMLATHDGTIIGRGGLRLIDPSVGEDLVEVGYAIARAHWGHGYATEATRAFIELAWSHHDLEQLGAITLVENLASARVLEKAGFSEERVVDHPAGVHRFFRLRRRATAG